MTDPNFNQLEREYIPSDFNATDSMLKKYVFEKNFEVEFPDREDWLNEVLEVEASSEQWFVDGSKTDYGTGYGVHLLNQSIVVSRSLGNNATVFQAEVRAINTCAELN